jgi:hypothetical protein
MTVRLHKEKNEAEIKANCACGIVQEIGKSRYAASIVKDGKIFRLGEFDIFRNAVKRVMKEITEIQINNIKL